MKRTKLSDYLKNEDKSQAELAAAVGLTQGAISKMMRSDRAIYVVETLQGITLREEKVVAETPSVSNNQAA